MLSVCLSVCALVRLDRWSGIVLWFCLAPSLEISQCCVRREILSSSRARVRVCVCWSVAVQYTGRPANQPLPYPLLALSLLCRLLPQPLLMRTADYSVSKGSSRWMALRSVRLSSTFPFVMSGYISNRTDGWTYVSTTGPYRIWQPWRATRSLGPLVGWTSYAPHSKLCALCNEFNASSAVAFSCVWIGLVWFILVRPCQHHNGYIDGR